MDWALAFDKFEFDFLVFTCRYDQVEVADLQLDSLGLRRGWSSGTKAFRKDTYHVISAECQREYWLVEFLVAVAFGLQSDNVALVVNGFDAQNGCLNNKRVQNEVLVVFVVVLGQVGSFPFLDWLFFAQFTNLN